MDDTSRLMAVRTNTSHPFWFALPLDTSPDAAGIVKNPLQHLVYAPSATTLLHGILDRGCIRADGSSALVVDVGANYGWFSLLAASYGCRAVAIEPQWDVATFFNASIRLNNFPEKIRIVVAAAGAGGDGQPYIVRNCHNGNPGWTTAEPLPPDGSVLPDSSDSGQCVNLGFTRSVRVDDLADEPVLLLKVDVEGGEASVLQSAERLAGQGFIDNVLIEIKPSQAQAEWMAWWRETMVRTGHFAYSFSEFYDDTPLRTAMARQGSVLQQQFWLHEETMETVATPRFQDVLFARDPVAAEGSVTCLLTRTGDAPPAPSAPSVAAQSARVCCKAVRLPVRNFVIGTLTAPEVGTRRAHAEGQPVTTVCIDLGGTTVPARMRIRIVHAASLEGASVGTVQLDVDLCTNTIGQLFEC